MMIAKRKNIADEIADILQHKILEMNLKEGDKLSSHDELTQELGVSKASLREGLQKLSAMGIIHIKHGLGTIVATPQIGNYLKILSPRLITKGTTLSDLFEARKYIESVTVVNAVERGDTQDFKELESLLLAMDQALKENNTEAFLRRDIEFHSSIAKAGKNSVLQELLNILNELLLFHENLTQRMPGGIEKALNYHHQIFDAIRNKNREKARRIMEEHIQDVQSQRMADLIIYSDALGTGSIGGTFFSVGSALSKVINRYSWLKAKAELTGGGIENVILTGQKRIALGITQSDVAINAFNGTREFSESYPNIRAVCGAHQLDLQIFTLKKNKIEALGDLRGKKVALGATGGASQWVSRFVLKSYDIAEADIIPQFLSISNAIDALNENKIDAVFYLSGGASSALLTFSENTLIRFLPIETEKLHNIIARCPYWTYSAISPHTYPQQNERIPTLGVPCILITHKDVGEDAVYSVVKSILEHTDEIAEEHPAGAEYCIKNSLRGVTIPLHAGAKRYFVENNIVTPEFKADSNPAMQV